MDLNEFKELNKSHKLNEFAHIQIVCEQCGPVKRRCVWYGAVTVPKLNL